MRKIFYIIGRDNSLGDFRLAKPSEEAWIKPKSRWNWLAGRREWTSTTAPAGVLQIYESEYDLQLCMGCKVTLGTPIACFDIPLNWWGPRCPRRWCQSSANIFILLWKLLTLARYLMNAIHFFLWLGLPNNIYLYHVCTTGADNSQECSQDNKNRSCLGTNLSWMWNFEVIQLYCLDHDIRSLVSCESCHYSAVVRCFHFL